MWLTKVLKNIRRDKEANEYRLMKLRDERKISYFIEDTLTDSYISVSINKDSQKEYELVKNMSEKENLEYNYIKQNKEEEEQPFFNYEEEKRMSREAKMDRINEVRRTGSYNKKKPEKKCYQTEKQKVRKEMEEITNRWDNSFF